MTALDHVFANDSDRRARARMQRDEQDRAQVRARTLSWETGLSEREAERYVLRSRER